ncbi:MAG: hypothetical protein H6600_04955 [Flavobacteriales bacterium]|nr:hypothetical protein [Flavobacteriales bacterium]MCB9197786.1 hypothetical protein [Flavobacteriales bacterium]
MSKIHLYLERFWLIVAITLTVIQLVYTFQQGLGDKMTQGLWLIVIFTWGMFLFRRGVRKRMEKFASQQPKKKKK